MAEPVEMVEETTDRDAGEVVILADYVGTVLFAVEIPAIAAIASFTRKSPRKSTWSVSSCTRPTEVCLLNVAEQRVSRPMTPFPGQRRN